MFHSELFESSAKRYPDSGYKMTKAECGFILPEIEGIIEKYKKDMEDPAMSPTLRRMCAHQLEGLEFILKGLQEGWGNEGSPCRIMKGAPVA